MLKDLLSRTDITTLILLVLGVICVIGFVKTDAPKKTVLLSEMCLALGITIIVPYNFYQAYQNLIPDAREGGYGDGYIYKYMPSAVSYVSLFGIEEFLLRDLRNMIHGTDEEDAETVRERISAFMDGNPEHLDNDMTGIFRDKSLIIIQAESLSTFAIDETLTPTLYRLQNSGWNFENFLAPLRNGSTSATEVMANTGLFPSNDGNVVSIAYADNYYPTALAKLFAADGYDVDAFHNNFANYYNRENFYPAIGYDNFMDPYRMQVENIESDYWCAQKIAWMDFQDPEYFTFWVTYSGHQDYLTDFDDPEKYGPHCAEEYEPYLKEVKQLYPDMAEELQVYLAKNMSLDRAVQYYIDILNRYGRDDVVICIYGDHPVKGVDDLFSSESEYGEDRSTNDTPLFIWTKGIEAKTITKYCNTMDIMPTITNLFGITYDTSTVIGRDIFDPDYDGFCFDWFLNVYNDEWTWSTMNDAYLDEPKNEKTKKQADETIAHFLEAINICTDIFQTDYFSTVD